MHRLHALAALATAFPLAACSTPRALPRKGAVVIREFTFPWSAKPAPRTEFRVSSIGERLHFRFHAEDHDIVVAPKGDLQQSAPLSNLFVSMLRHMQIEADKFGTGTVIGLEMA